MKKAFGPKVVLRDVSLDVYEGETLTVMGASGCGKSVLLKILIRLIEADEGIILFHGEDIRTMSDSRLAFVRRSIAMLFQGGALFDSLDVRDNVAYGLHEHFQHEMTESAIDERVAWALGLVGLPGIEAMDPASLSGGMKKRVALARAIAVHPEVLLYDEPTGGLDPINTERVNELIRSLQKELHCSSIVVTHDMKSAFTISDRIAMLHRGEVIACGTPDVIRGSRDPRIIDFVGGIARGSGENIELFAGA